jgi:hypothetical protein
MMAPSRARRKLWPELDRQVPFGEYSGMRTAVVWRVAALVLTAAPLSSDSRT